MKTFIEYLNETQKTYEWKIKIANVDPKDHMDCLEACLDGYHLESISKPKSLPITESNIDFPSFSSPEIWVLEAVLKYPVMADQLRAIVAEKLNISQSQVAVMSPQQEVIRDGVDDIKEFEKGTSVLEEELPEATKEQKEASEAYASRTPLLKELSTPKVEVAGSDDTPEGNAGKTTNDLPSGDASPVGSKQNAIPTAK
jgi:hypothetical protein